MVQIENYLINLLDKFEIHFPFIQYPINLRILFPEKPEGYDSKEYNVDAIHCDHWSGSPLDSTNCFLYVHKEANSPELIFHKFDNTKFPLVENYRGSYKYAPDIEYKKLISPIPSNGLLNIWDCTVPHRVQRNTSGVTISIDFRLRNDSKNFEKDLNKNLNQYWLNSKMESLALYWIKLKKRPVNFKDKIQLELEEASQKYSKEYLDIRKKYINYFYHNF